MIVTYRMIKEMVDSAEQSFNQLEQLADQLQAAVTNPQQFQQVEQLSNHISQQMQQIVQFARQGRQA